MNVTVSDVSDLRKELIVSFSSAELVEEEKAVVAEFRKQARIAGFRQGKAPVELIRKRFQKGVSEELGKKIAAKGYEFAVKEKDLKVYTVVDISRLETIDVGQDLAIDITVDLVPTFDLPTYKDLPTTAPSTEVSDEEVDATIERIRRERADFQVVEREAAVGDYVKVSYVGKVGETPVAELVPDEPANRAWGSIENGWEEAGTDEAKQFGVPAVIDGIVGLKAGESKTVSQDFAEDFRIEALRGQTGTYEIAVHEVRERILPELDEAFLKTLQVESLEDLKGRILDDLEARKRQKSIEAQRQQVIEQLLAAVEFPVPETAVESETQAVMARVMMENMRRGVPQEEFENNKEAFHAQSSQVAARDVKLQFLLFKIAQEESIEVTQEDLQRGIMSLAMQQRRSPDELVKELRDDRRRIQDLQRQLLFGKTLDFLVKAAKVQNVANEASAEA